MIVKPSADSLISAVTQAAKNGPPPVHLWNPAFCGDIDMRIARDGTWYYLGTPIGRAPMVKLFSSILKREGEAYFLVTPVEKVGIKVDDAPLLAVELDNPEYWAARQQFLDGLCSRDFDALALAERSMLQPIPQIINWFQRWSYDLASLSYGQ